MLIGLCFIVSGAVATWHVVHEKAASVPKIVLRRGNGAEPESLDPQLARSEGALTLLRDLYEGLTAIGADGEPVLAAADRCVISPDGKTYRFHLRAGLRWSNGDRVVAEDFAAAWRRLVDPRTGAQYADLLNVVRGAAAITRGTAAPGTLGVRAEDADDFTVELTHPTPYFLGILALPAAQQAGARSARPRFHQTGRHGVERSVRADPVGFRVAPGRDTQPALLERREYAVGRRGILLVRRS